MKNICESVISRGYITEREIITLKSRINRARFGRNSDKYDPWQDFNTMYDHFNGEIPISLEQTQKGLSWCMDQWKTARGIQRKHNPFGDREQSVLESFQRFFLVDFYAAGNYVPFFVPVYRTEGEKNYFDYYAGIGKNGFTAVIVG